MKKKDVFWGLLFLLAAALIIISQFGFFPGVGMFELVVTVILGGIIIKSIMSINFWGVLFPLAFIGILFDEQLGITEFTPWQILVTALLLSLGLSLIFKRPGFVFSIHHNHEFNSSVINEQDDNVVSCSVSFGDSIKYVNTTNFEKANIKCSFGDVKVYFDHAEIPSGNADIYVDVSFGEAVLFIPRSWKVVNRVQVFLGDMSENHKSESLDSPVVTIHGNVSFGDIQVIYI